MLDDDIKTSNFTMGKSPVIDDLNSKFYNLVQSNLKDIDFKKFNMCEEKWALSANDAFESANIDSIRIKVYKINCKVDYGKKLYWIKFGVRYDPIDDHGLYIRATFSSPEKFAYETYLAKYSNSLIIMKFGSIYEKDFSNCLSRQIQFGECHSDFDFYNIYINYFLVED